MQHDIMTRETGGPRGAGSSFATATGKRSTGKDRPFLQIEGVLFLTAGYGRRDEPLSLIRPKALLPYADTTVLARLARQVQIASPGKIGLNASRCRDALMSEISTVWQEDMCRLYFEERPLGASATLARLAGEMSGGTWMVVNTDMIIEEFDVLGMVEQHFRTGSAWTVLTGQFPAEGSYAPLLLDENGQFGCGGIDKAHYWGVSLMEPVVPSTAAEIQASGGLFSELASEAAARSYHLSSYRNAGSWLDMGTIDSLRGNILSGGPYIHPSACVSSDAVLSGTWNIGKGCILGRGTVLKDSVMLEGSSLEHGTLAESILPWFCSSRDGKSV
jgi:NDP-sugar pyrophosphorylase family protein